MQIANLASIYDKPVTFGIKRRCINPDCSQLILRKRKRTQTGHPKYCTYNCMRRFHRKRQYIKNRAREREYRKNWGLKHPDRIKILNDKFNEMRKHRKDWNQNYLETLKV